MLDANTTSQVMEDEKVRLTYSAAVTSRSAGELAGASPPMRRPPTGREQDHRQDKEDADARIL